jgi:hypothetical protein
MQKNRFLGGMLLLLIGCSQERGTPKLLISSFEIKDESSSHLVRKLASKNEVQCLDSIFSVETLKEEIRLLERKYASGAKVTGSWKHLNLAELPIPQANFLKTYGSRIGDLKDPGKIDYSGCFDVPCIYNRIYGNGDSIAGYVHYLWYLRFGHMLSADNLVPDQKSKFPGVYRGKNYPLSSYLYNEDELYGFWRLSLMLGPPMTTLSSMDEIQRIPRGEFFEDRDEFICGLASNGGYIRLTDRCLKIDRNLDRGYLYPAVSHEIAHEVDYEEGRKRYQATYRSEQPDYLKFAGMTLNEYKDESGTLIREWKVKSGTKFVTGYSSFTPAENFAETLAYYRHDGDETIENISAEHARFVAKDYFQNRSFDRKSLFKRWIQKNIPEISQSSLKAIITCTNESTNFPKSAYYDLKDFAAPLLPSQKDCLAAEAQELSVSLRSKISLQEPEACNSFQYYKSQSEWDPLFKAQLLAFLNKYLLEIKKDKDYIAHIQKFYDQLKDKTMAREAYMNCFQEQKEEACYEKEVNSLALTRALKLKLPTEHAQELADLYQSYHSYEEIRLGLKSSYHTFLLSQQEIIRNQTEQLWEYCQTIPVNDEETPSGKHFIVNSGYMVSSHFNCLNARFTETLKHTVREFSIDERRVEHAKEELLLSQEVKPLMQKLLQEKFEQQREEELKLSQSLISQDQGEIRKKMESDFSWITDIMKNAQFEKDCLSRSLALIDFNPSCNLKSDLFQDYIKKSVCSIIRESHAFNQWLGDSKELYMEKISLESEKMMEKLATERAQVCVEEYPLDSTLNRIRYKRQREACLLDDWHKMEANVLKDFADNPVARKFNLSSEEMKRKLEVNRRRLQLRIIKDYFNP